MRINVVIIQRGRLKESFTFTFLVAHAERNSEVGGTGSHFLRESLGIPLVWSGGLWAGICASAQLDPKFHNKRWGSTVGCRHRKERKMPAP